MKNLRRSEVPQERRATEKRMQFDPKRITSLLMTVITSPSLQECRDRIHALRVPSS